MVVSLHWIVLNYGIVASAYLQVVGLVELQKELVGIDRNDFLIKRECWFFVLL